jgi:hypothetical protein
MLTLPEELGRLNALKILDVSQVQQIEYTLLMICASELALYLKGL